MVSGKGQTGPITLSSFQMDASALSASFHFKVFQSFQRSAVFWETGVRQIYISFPSVQRGRVQHIAINSKGTMACRQPNLCALVFASWVMVRQGASPYAHFLSCPSGERTNHALHATAPSSAS